MSEPMGDPVVALLEELVRWQRVAALPRREPSPRKHSAATAAEPCSTPPTEPKPYESSPT